MLTGFIQFLNTHTPLLYLTQSLWRDEAFSVLVARPGGIETIRITAADFTPPLYYLLLHYWMNIFGEGEIAIRMLSFLFFLAFLVVFYKFSKTIFKNSWAKISLLLASTNPMLVYYAFEARTYSLFALTSTASMYYFYINNRIAYIIATTLALYTHPYTVFIPFTQGLYLLIKKRLNREKIAMMIVPFILYIPWMFVIVEQVKRTGQMWMYPINTNLVQSVLGNLLIAYDGTPGFLWNNMKILSLIVFVLYIYAINTKKKWKKNSLFFLWVFVPLVIVLAISYVKPIYVNRYIIMVSVGQILLLSIALQSIPNALIRKTLTLFFFAVWIYTLYFLPPYVKKVDLRSSFQHVNAIAQNGDFIYANTPLVFFESLYYSNNQNSVYLYNPDQITLPPYLGTILIPTSKHKDIFPQYPKRTFMIYENGHFEIFSGFPEITN